MAERIATYTKSYVAKNGEKKEYVCTGRYTTKTTIKRKMGKEIAKKRIASCNDKEKIDAIYAYMLEIGM